MEYRKLNGSGLYVPALTLGTATFGGTHGFESWDIRQPKSYPYWHQDQRPELKSQLFF